MMDFARYYSQGVPQHIGIDIDTAKFTSAFSYIDQHGERQSVTPWKKAPPVYQFGPVFDARKTEHDAEVAAWDEYYTLNAGLVPARFMASSKLQDDIARLSEEQRKSEHILTNYHLFFLVGLNAYHRSASSSRWGVPGNRYQ